MTTVAVLTLHNSLELFDLETPMKRTTIKLLKDFASVCFSYDGSLLFCMNKFSVQIRSGIDGALINSVSNKTSYVFNTCLCSSVSGLLIVGSNEGVFSLNPTSGEKTKIGNEQEIVRSMDFSPDGTRLALLFYKNTILIMDTSTWEMIHRTENNKNCLFSRIKFSPNGELLGVCGFKLTGVYDFQNEQFVWKTSESSHPLEFSLDGSVLVSSSRGCVRVWETMTGNALTSIPFPKNSGISPEFALAGSRLFIVPGDGGLYEYTIHGELVDSVRLERPIREIHFRPENVILL
jgi:WD40 repeat protein